MEHVGHETLFVSLGFETGRWQIVKELPIPWQINNRIIGGSLFVQSSGGGEWSVWVSMKMTSLFLCLNYQQIVQRLPRKCKV
ncbi:hypothetical protein EPI10_032458 [Gossypium australe]|uniref:Uncharacterized protein n=1 Tax=Gossypium australe TaxID=47621 RepID=A0A5B6X611_9ROSI|nr:hypothetical protein EPI10_032458 [Gossypium australe]